MKAKFSIVSIVGRSGSGKGTQAGLLRKAMGFEIIRTGALLRERAKRKDVVGKTIERVLDQGGLIPTPIVFSLWMPRLEQLKNNGKAKGIIFDGNPRKLYEAQMLDELFMMFGWEKRFRVCYIYTSENKAKKRLLQRRRYDDTPKEIRERLRYFLREVEPMIEYYEKRGMLIKINGEQSIENVHKEILRKLKTFLR